jgi:superfamily I DNA/RNA helicase
MIRVWQEYESRLKENDMLDFNDMINKATEYIANGVVKTKYRYILVDEFQDISQSRYRLLRALLDANTLARAEVLSYVRESLFGIHYNRFIPGSNTGAVFYARCATVF